MKESARYDSVLQNNMHTQTQMYEVYIVKCQWFSLSRRILATEKILTLLSF